MVTSEVHLAPEPVGRRPPADRAMRRLLCVPERRPAGSEEQAYRLFSVSMVISGLRCLLTYLILPILAPILGATGGVGPAIGIPLGVVALIFDVRGIRRFWVADHRWRWYMTGVYVLVIAFVLVLLVGNVASLA